MTPSELYQGLLTAPWPNKIAGLLVLGLMARTIYIMMRAGRHTVTGLEMIWRGLAERRRRHAQR